MDYIVKDSSIHPNTKQYAAYESRDSTIKMGIVREVYQASSSETKYVVEVQHIGKPVPIACSLMTRWGGVQNYEEYSLRPYMGSPTTDNISAPDMPFQTRVGDVVLVACINGNYREGVILGGVRHPGRKSTAVPGDIAYISQFNGIEKKITTSGGYRVTNKGVIPATLDAAIPGVPILPEISNPTVGGTYYELGDDGSWTVTDGLLQTIKIDKSGSTTTITAGKCSITLDVKGLSTTVDAPKIIINSLAQTDITTKILNIEAMFSAKLKAKQIAIGNETFELLQGLINLIDGLGQLVVTSPSGPCNPLNSAPTWLVNVEAIKARIQMIKGSL